MYSPDQVPDSDIKEKIRIMTEKIDGNITKNFGSVKLYIPGRVIHLRRSYEGYYYYY